MHLSFFKSIVTIIIIIILSTFRDDMTFHWVTCDARWCPDFFKTSFSQEVLIQVLFQYICIPLSSFLHNPLWHISITKSRLNTIDKNAEGNNWNSLGWSDDRSDREKNAPILSFWTDSEFGITNRDDRRGWQDQCFWDNLSSPDKRSQELWSIVWSDVQGWDPDEG